METMITKAVAVVVEMEEMVAVPLMQALEETVVQHLPITEV